MTIDTFLDFSETAASNVDVAGIGIQGTNAVQNFDNAFRQLMAILRRDLDNGVVLTSKSAGYTAVANDNNSLIRFSAAATLSLTAAATLGANWHCWVMADGGAVVIDPNSSETINGATTITIPDGSSTLVICDGTNFRALEDYLDLQPAVDVASATTTDIGAVASKYVRVTGTTTITGLGTATSGLTRRLRFADTLTLTHNGTSLILPGAANITTAAGDIFDFVSEGSGNWRCVNYEPARLTSLIVGSLTASTSGTAVDFTSIPPWVRRISINFNGVSTNGTDALLLQIGDSGGIENSGYTGTSSLTVSTVATTAYTAGFGIRYASATTAVSGRLVLELMDAATNLWSVSGGLSVTGSVDGTIATGGSKSLSATLDRVRITTTGGTNTFDAGSINIVYE